MKASYGGIKTEYIILGVVILIVFFLMSGSSDDGSDSPSGNTAAPGNGGYTGPLPTNMSSSANAQSGAEMGGPVGSAVSWITNLFN